MQEREHEKKQLEEQLEKVKQRLLILDMIEDKLLQMKELAQIVIDEDLADEEIKEINKQVKDLAEQVKLLYSEGTQLS